MVPQAAPLGEEAAPLHLQVVPRPSTARWAKERPLTDEEAQLRDEREAEAARRAAAVAKIRAWREQAGAGREAREERRRRAAAAARAEAARAKAEHEAAKVARRAEVLGRSPGWWAEPSPRPHA